MKLIMIIFDSDKEGVIHDILADKKITGFTTWGPVHGKGKQSDPRMGSQVWPGDNRIIITVIQDDIADTLRATLQSHPDTLRGNGVKVFELAANTWL